MRLLYMRLLVVVAALAAVAGCSSSSGRGIDVGKVKVTSTATVPLRGPGLLSPDGTKILELYWPLCVLDVDGTHKVCMSSDSRAAPDTQDAVWSPDGKYVAFSDDFFRLFREPDIWVMDAASGKVTDLTKDGITRLNPIRAIPKGAKIDLYPSWSADSRTIRFARQVGNSGPIELESVPVGGGKVSTLGTIRGRLTNLLGLAFSPDATMVAYSYADPDFSKGAVHVQQVGPVSALQVIGVLGSPGRTLGRTDGDHSLLSFSPDGRYLLVDNMTRYGSFGGPPVSTARIYPTSGGPGRPVARGVHAVWPTWAPSGHALAFVSLGRAGHTPLQVVAEPGDTPRTIRSGNYYSAGDMSRLGWEGDVILLDAAGKATLLKLR